MATERTFQHCNKKNEVPLFYGYVRVNSRRRPCRNDGVDLLSTTNANITRNQTICPEQWQYSIALICLTIFQI